MEYRAASTNPPNHDNDRIMKLLKINLSYDDYITDNSKFHLFKELFSQYRQEVGALKIFTFFLILKFLHYRTPTKTCQKLTKLSSWTTPKMPVWSSSLNGQKLWTIRYTSSSSPDSKSSSF